MFTGQQIRDKRKAENLSVEELAALLVVKKESLYKWEKGTKPNNPEDFGKIERWLNKKMETVPNNLENNSKNISDETYQALIRTLENMSHEKMKSTEVVDKLAEDKIRSTAIIERLVTMIEQQFSFAPTGKAHAGQQQNSSQVDDPAFEDVGLGKGLNYAGNNKPLKKGT